MTAAEPRGAAPGARIRPATGADLDRLIDIIWSVAAEGRWIGAQVPFDRQRRRSTLESALGDEAWTILVAEAASGDGSDVVGADVVGGGAVGSDVVGSEVVGSDVVGGEVVGSDVVGSEVVGSEVGEVVVGEEVVGEVAVNLAPYGVANLSMLLLDGWRGRGIGTALLDAGIEWARTAGAHKVALEVWPHNEPALRLYRRRGFVEEGRKRRHYRRANGELWDAILMGLPLT